jgi:hypothetical protein
MGASLTMIDRHYGHLARDEHAIKLLDFVEPRRAQARPILQRAIERGELPTTTNVELALDLLYGPVYHRLLHGHAPLNERFLRDLVDTVLAGLATTHGRPTVARS